jgi:hypothetical protein
VNSRRLREPRLIYKKEFLKLKDSLAQLKEELLACYSVEMQYAEFRPRPSALFEYFVLYNAAMANNPRKLVLNRVSRGDFRAVGTLPIPSEKSYRTVWRMGETIKPTIVTQNDHELDFWFDRATAQGLRPDIVVRTGKFEIKGEISSHVQLLKDGDVFAEYADKSLDRKDGYFVESQKYTASDGNTYYLCFRAKNDYKTPPLIIECKSIGATLGNLEEYAKSALNVVIVSPEKLYQPKRGNIHIIKVGKEFSNSELREALRPHLGMLN